MLKSQLFIVSREFRNVNHIIQKHPHELLLDNFIVSRKRTLENRPKLESKSSTVEVDVSSCPKTFCELNESQPIFPSTFENETQIESPWIDISRQPTATDLFIPELKQEILMEDTELRICKSSEKEKEDVDRKGFLSFVHYMD